ncbi:MAG TPA: hypothetical protein VGX23_18135 [Actinocrinis sp.]|nr:hypothetical protein [Actinocrinis sp.]
MAHDATGSRRVVVGVDASGRAAFAALWAAREAVERGIGVLSRTERGRSGSDPGRSERRPRDRRPCPEHVLPDQRSEPTRG